MDIHNTISSIAPRDFEEFVAELWTLLGWKAITTRSSGDDGIDVIATRQEPYQQKKLIQVKQHNGPLSRRHVQQYSYLHCKPNVDEVLLVNPSGFTSGAYDSAKEANVKLIGSDTLATLIGKVSAYDLLERYSSSNISTSNRRLEKSEDDLEELHITDEERDEFTDIARSDDIYSILLQSLPCSEEVSDATKLAIALQLFRGEDKLHVLIVMEAGDLGTKLLEDISNLYNLFGYVNCITATTGGLIGEYNSAGQTQRGVFSEYPHGIVALDRLDQFRDQETLLEPLERQRVTITRADHHQEYPMEFSCLATCEVKWGKIDEYESIDDQIPLSPGLLSRFDSKVFIGDEFSENTLLQGIIESDSSSIQPLPLDQLIKYASVANNRFPHPQLNEGARAKLDKITDKMIDMEVIDVDNSTIKSASILAQAHARMRYSNTVIAEDVEVSVQALLLSYTIEDLFDSSIDEIDANMTESETSRSQRKRVENIIRGIQTEYDEGAPTEKVLERAGEVGLARSKVEYEIEQLKCRGQAYEPRSDHLRTT